jgi:hypothetical protein
MTLLSLASKQIWPQVLAILHFKPEHVILLHSEDSKESKTPAQRLKRFFDATSLVPRGGTKMETIPHDNFIGIEHRLDEIASTHSVNLSECLLNFTGGNKLMATAAFRWATRRGLKSFYLERGLQLTQFEPCDGELTTTITNLDGHLTDHIDPVALIRCQLEASEIERDGETITLSSQGRQISEAELFKRLRNGNDPTSLLQFNNQLTELPKEGDGLELTVAAALLKLGIHQVQRGLRLKVRSVQNVGTRLPHAEIDLLFNWAGRLWLVDCKDRIAPEALVERLWLELQRYDISHYARELLARIKDELSISQTKNMKEDLLAVREAGGLLGNIVCVRKSHLPEEVSQFAKHYNIHVIEKQHLVEQLELLLNPQKIATPEQLRMLQQKFS